MCKWMYYLLKYCKVMISQLHRKGGGGMETLYWSCFIFGILYTVIVVIFGDLLEGALDATFEWLQLDNLPLVQPITLIGGISIFGGAGILLSRYSELHRGYIFLLALAIGICGVIFLYFAYVKPMENAENSLSYSVTQLVGKEASVSTAIPVDGFGEVIVKVGAGISNHIAASYDQKPIAADRSTVVMEVKEGVLYVSEIDIS